MVRPKGTVREFSLTHELVMELVHSVFLVVLQWIRFGYAQTAPIAGKYTKQHQDASDHRSASCTNIMPSVEAGRVAHQCQSSEYLTTHIARQTHSPVQKADVRMSTHHAHLGLCLKALRGVPDRTAEVTEGRHVYRDTETERWKDVNMKHSRPLGECQGCKSCEKSS